MAIDENSSFPLLQAPGPTLTNPNQVADPNQVSVRWGDEQKTKPTTTKNTHIIIKEKPRSEKRYCLVPCVII